MSKVRERILETASQLFYQRGIPAAGVDAIIQGADVARMSFYRHFRSKEGLVVAYLARRDRATLEWFERRVTELAPNARHRPLAVFEALAERFASEQYRGCGFINAMVESPDRTSAAHRTAAAHKASFQALLARLLRDAGLPESAASDLLLLFDGAVVAAMREGTAAPARRAMRLAAARLGVSVPARFAQRTRAAR